jgi:hypothetical protein
MRRELVRMNTVPAEHDRDLARAALRPAPSGDEAVRRRDDAVRRMRAAREALASEIAGVAAIEALRDDQWSIVHVLAHLGADGGGHFSPVYDMLERGMRELPAFETRDERFTAAIESALERIDEDIAFAVGLGADQLLLRAPKQGADHYVLGYVEAAAEHVEAHVAQLRGIRRHLAEVRERRQAAGSAAGS